MISSNKIIFVIFFILLIVTGIEIYFFFFSQVKTINKLSPITTTQTPLLISRTPSPAPIIAPSVKNQAFNRDELSSLFPIKKGVVKSSTIISEFQGNIIEIDSKGGIVPIDKFKYKLKIRIKGGSEDTNTFYFSNNEVNKIKVFYLNKDQKIPFALNKLNIGDKISLKTTSDLLKNIEDDCLVEGEIIKL